MDPDTPQAAEDRFAALLEAADEALAVGAQPTLPGEVAEDTELLRRLHAAQACLRLLHHVQLADRACPSPLPLSPWGRGVGVRGADTPVPGRTGPAWEGDELPVLIGRFQIVRELGRGGFGVVFMALDPELGREVALKVPRPEALFTPNLRQRFLREGKAAASLSHHNILPVFEAGRAGPVCYIASAYVRGITLAQWVRENGPGAPEAAAGLVLPLAEAMQHAHQRGILHRDLKPANVLLQLLTPLPLGERGRGEGGTEIQENRAVGDVESPARSLASAVPLIMDFGLAKEIGGAGDTVSGAVVGTPSYMAPEQAEGRNREVGPAADIYALGGVLYELLTGLPPFRKETHIATLQAVLRDEPAPPRKLRPAVPRDLEAICLKCLEKKPEARYPHAQALADDLRRFQAREPIQARRIGPVERVGRWCGRNPVVATLTAAVALLLITVAVGSLVALVDIAHSRQLAEDKASDERRARLSEAKERIRAEEAQKKARLAAEDAQREAATATRVSHFLIGLFQGSDPLGWRGYIVGQSQNATANLTARELLDRGAERIRKDLKQEPLVRASMMDAIASVYLSLALFDDARPLLEEALRIRQRELKEDDVAVAESLHSLAISLYYQADREAETRIRRALDIYRKALGPEHEKVAFCLSHLAVILSMERFIWWNQAVEEQLLKVGDELLAMRPKVSGEAERAVALGMVAVAPLVGQQGNLSEALKLAGEAQSIFAKFQGKDNPGSAMALVQQAFVFQQFGNLPRATDLWGEALKMGQASMGRGHPFTAFIQHGYAKMLRLQGEHERALAQYRGAEQAFNQAYGPDNPWNSRVLDSIGRTLHALGRLDEAEAPLRKSVALGSAARGDQAPTVRYTKRFLAQLLRQQGTALARTGNHKEAASKLAEVWSIYGTLSLQHAKTARPVLQTLVDSLIRTESFAAAAKVLLDDQGDAQAGPQNQLADDTLRLLVRVYEAWGRPEEANRCRAMLAKR